MPFRKLSSQFQMLTFSLPNSFVILAILLFQIGVLYPDTSLFASELEQSPSSSEARLNSPLSFNVGIDSDYRYRGISQTKGKPALSLGADYEFSTGWYVGTWVSTLSSLNDDSQENLGPLELDFYGGYRFNLGSVDFDLGILHFEYPWKNIPSGPDRPPPVGTNTTDWYVATTFKTITLKYSQSFTHFFGDPDFVGSKYIEASVPFELGNNFSLTAHIGRQTFQNAAYTKARYTDVSLALRKSFGNGLEGSLIAVSTNALREDYTSDNGNFDGKSALIFGLKYIF
jgi:uncharacterized protein (TIGR02001 family)